MIKDIFIITLIISLCVAVYFVFFNRPPLNTIKIKIKGHTYNLEVAQTIPQKMTGLMNRTSLCPNCGMIFISTVDTPQSFWMKNTFIPLDMIFVDKQGIVVNILTAEAEAKDANGSYKFFHSTAPAAYVIELNAGDAQKLKLSPGDVIEL